MRLVTFAPGGFDKELAAFRGTASSSRAVEEVVRRILADVRRQGDRAVARYARKFDRAALRPSAFRVRPAEIAAALRALPQPRRRALSAVHAAVLDFNRKGRPAGWSARNRHGARVGEKFDPVRRVGLYIPGGEVPLVSTVLMTATLAAVAGCPGVAAFTPGGPGGRVSPDLLAALALAGVSEVYRIGGVQAIGAMAYGTRTIPAVDKIFGPGNAYVCEAKRQVFGTVGVDLLPGPSELMVIADGSARASDAAADLLAQAEHGSGMEKLYLVSPSLSIIRAIAAQMERQMAGLGRADRIRRVVDSGFLAVRVKDLAQAAQVANRVAPEHLELLVGSRPARGLAAQVTTAGAIMMGGATPTVVGDFAAGPSHVLPTGGAGRFSSGLRVEDFMRRTSLLDYSLPSLRRALPVIEALAAMERLDAHGRSASVRFAGPAR
ncbi:MAG TPA: histidinol dehydrogenase [Opitutaceae bacterium]